MRHSKPLTVLNVVIPELIEDARLLPQEERVSCAPDESCVMCDGLYLKANGELPCWCGPGEHLLLGKIDSEQLNTPGFDVFNSEMNRLIRHAFYVEKRLPFPKYCMTCADRRAHSGDPGLKKKHIELLHIEPAWLCNLDCAICVPKARRTSIKGPPYYLETDMWKAFIGNLRRNGIESVRGLHIEGRGEPLMHPDLPLLIRMFKDAYPGTFVSITTNANFTFRDGLFQCGLDHLRLSIDGSNAENYPIYRRGGSWEKVLAFMRSAVEARSRLNASVNIQWKYIVFEWNDTDEELLEAYRLALELGIDISFCLTHTPGKSLRFTYDSLQAKLEQLMPLARNRPSTHIANKEILDQLD